MNKELLSIKDFSELAGISKQAVYSQLDSRLKPFLVQVDGKKMLKKEALEKFYSTKSQSSFNQVEQENSTVSDEQKQTNLSAELIEILKEEIKKKDQQIERLQLQLDKERDALKQAYSQIADMAQKAQYITAADKTEKIMQQQPDQEEIIKPAVNIENHNIEKEKETEKISKKKWFQFWK